MLVKFLFFQRICFSSIFGILTCHLLATFAFGMTEGEEEIRTAGLTHPIIRPEGSDDEKDWDMGPNWFPLEAFPFLKSTSLEERGTGNLPDLSLSLREKTHSEQDFNQAVQRILDRKGNDLVQLVFRSPFCTLAFLKGLKASFDGLNITDESERAQYEIPIHEAILTHPEARSGDKVCVADYYKRIGLQARAGEIYLSLVSGRPIVIKRLRAGFEYCKGGASEANLHLMILKHHYHDQKDIEAAIAFVRKAENEQWRNETLRALDVKSEIPNDFAVLKASREAWIGYNKDHVKTIEERILGHAECRNPDRRIIRDSCSGKAEEIADVIVLERGTLGQYWSGEVYTLDDLRRATQLSSKPEKTRGYYVRLLKMEGHEKEDLLNAMGFTENHRDYPDLVEMVLKDPLLKEPESRVPFLKRAIDFYGTAKGDKKRMNELWREVPLSYFKGDPNIVECRAVRLAWVDLNNITLSRDPLEFLNTLLETHKDATPADRLLVAYTCLSIPSLEEVGKRKLPDVEKSLKQAQREEDARFNEEIEELKRKQKSSLDEIDRKRKEKLDEEVKRDLYVKSERKKLTRPWHYYNTPPYELTKDYENFGRRINALVKEIGNLDRCIVSATQTIGEKKDRTGAMKKEAYTHAALFFSDLSTPNTKMAVQLWDIVFEADWASYAASPSDVWMPEVKLSALELEKAAQAYESEGQIERAMLIYKRLYSRHNQDWPIPLKLIQLYVRCGKDDLAKSLYKSINGSSCYTQEQKAEAYSAAYTLVERTVNAATAAASSAVAAVTPKETKKKTPGSAWTTRD